MADGRKIITVLEPEDEYPHEPDEAQNYNESMYLNGFDVDQEVGGWFRLGNRVNEGYAEMSVCLYLPGGRVGFMFGRPHIDTNKEMRAGGLAIEVIEPFKHLREHDEEGNTLRRTLGFGSLGGATLDNEENYLIKKLFTALGAIQIENQARI